MATVFLLIVVVAVPDIGHHPGKLRRVDFLVLHGHEHAGSQQVFLRHLCLFVRREGLVGLVEGHGPEEGFELEVELVLDAAEDQHGFLHIDLMHWGRGHGERGGVLDGGGGLDFVGVVALALGTEGLGSVGLGEGPGERVSVLHIAK